MNVRFGKEGYWRREDAAYYLCGTHQNGEDHDFATLRAAKEWFAEYDVQITKRARNFNHKKKLACKKGGGKRPDPAPKTTERRLEGCNRTTCVKT